MFEDTRRKVVFIDWNIYVHKAIFAKQDLPITYTCIRMIFALLKVLDVKPTDIIILAVDSPKGSWRKKIDSNYKSNRKALREKTGLDWVKLYGEFADFLENLKISTPFHIVEIDKLEADDIIAYGVRYFKDDECIIISSDTDYEQLTVFSNVKLLSSNSKKFKIVNKPYSSLAGKIRYEKTDNLISPILNQNDFEKRNKIVNLISLPAEIDSAVHCELERVSNSAKTYDTSLFRFNTLQEDLENLYTSTKKKLSFSDSFKKKKKKVEQSTLF